MTPGNLEFVEVVISLSVWTGGVAAVLKLDERRSERWSEHAWLPASVDAAILGTFLFSMPYGVVALLVHFVKSRWSLLGLGLGLLFAIAILALDVGAQIGAEAAIDWLGL
jgi:hypothetical protein